MNTQGWFSAQETLHLRVGSFRPSPSPAPRGSDRPAGGDSALGEGPKPCRPHCSERPPTPSPPYISSAAGLQRKVLLRCCCRRPPPSSPFTWRLPAALRINRDSGRAGASAPATSAPSTEADPSTTSSADRLSVPSRPRRSFLPSLPLCLLPSGGSDANQPKWRRAGRQEGGAPPSPPPLVGAVRARL